MIKSVIFDFDGVIVESVDIKTQAFAKLFENENENADAVKKIVVYHLQNTGISRFVKFRHIYEHILKKDLSEELYHRLCARFSNLVVEEVISAEYVHGAKDFLDRYCGFYDFFVASATPQQELNEIIVRRQMTHYFKEVFGAPLKKTDAIKTIMEKNALAAEEIVFIGDALSDYEAARNNRTSFIARLVNPDTIFQNIACAKVADLTGIHAVIQAINR